jgi:hypothetical protein
MQHMRATLQRAKGVEIRAGHKDLRAEIFETFIERAGRHRPRRPEARLYRGVVPPLAFAVNASYADDEIRGFRAD